MPYTLIVHLTNTDPVVGESDELPTPTDQLIILNNPRYRDGKDIPYLANEAVQAIYPIHRISFIEVIATEKDEDIIGFVRE